MNRVHPKRRKRVQSEVKLNINIPTLLSTIVHWLLGVNKHSLQSGG